MSLVLDFRVLYELGLNLSVLLLARIDRYPDVGVSSGGGNPVAGLGVLSTGVGGVFR